MISICVWDSPLRYSSPTSSKRILGFSIRRRMLACVMSLFSITPSRTRESSIESPGIFSVRA